MKRGGPLRRKSRLKNRTPLNRRNAERLERRRAKQFGAQAELCRRSRCCACGAQPPSDPAHVVSRGAGGTDEDTVPLCRRCHNEQHSAGIQTFQERHHVDLKAVAEEMRRRVVRGS